jgi:hypothetical protein
MRGNEKAVKYEKSFSKKRAQEEIDLFVCVRYGYAKCNKMKRFEAENDINSYFIYSMSNHNEPYL